MASVFVFLAYGASLALVFVLLYFFQARPWYWHIISVAAALAIGVIHFPEAWIGPVFDLAIGVVFVFLLMWGVLGLLYRAFDHHERLTRHHAR